MRIPGPGHSCSRVSLTLLHQGRPGLASLRTKASSFMCEILGRLVRPYDDDAKIQYSLRFAWLTVEEALSEDPEVIKCFADRDEFEVNVEHEGEKEVIELLRDTAKKGSWLDIIENRIFFKHIPEDSEPISTALTDVRAWDAPFKGDAADLLVATIPMYSTSKKEGDFTPTL
ncbi:hypothetical protein F5888DRAFT_658191 [Russula emetica]|nr:hypothetical protein F5888DRAFT_658191 [Russula emetica]